MGMPRSKLSKSEAKRLQKIVHDDASFARLINYFKADARDMVATLKAMDAKFADATETCEGPADVDDLEGQDYWTANAYYLIDWETHYDRLMSEYKDAKGQ